MLRLGLVNSKIPSTADNNDKTTLGETKDAAAKLNPTSGFLGWAKAMVMGILLVENKGVYLHLYLWRLYEETKAHDQGPWTCEKGAGGE